MKKEQHLVIVESPTKAKTLAKFLPKEYKISSSMGHIRDLPGSAREVPKEIKKESWANLGINYLKGFEPCYVIPKEKEKILKQLKSDLEKSKSLILATDDDREGESISWHLMEVLRPKIPIQRMVFHQISKSAVLDALNNFREVNQNLVSAQETRRILDRLVGYTISPLLWKKITAKLSAGRVQSVAMNLIVEKELERMNFVKAKYWGLSASLQKTTLKKDNKEFEVTLVEVNNKKLTTSKDFDSKTGKLKTDSYLLLEKEGKMLQAELVKKDWVVENLQTKQQQQNPYPPFITSTLQQEASNKLKFSARETMGIAQSLYEKGYITYMRTDSVQISKAKIDDVRKSILKLWGERFINPEVRLYKSKSKNTQEAHEAIHPVDISIDPKSVGENRAESSLYLLIWQRTIASQMSSAIKEFVNVDIAVANCIFRGTGKKIIHEGYQAAYNLDKNDEEQMLPNLEKGEKLNCKDLQADAHETNPPVRYTEAGLIKFLEKEDIGRPSTYASIISTIISRNYVKKISDAFVPTFIAFAVSKFLRDNFPDFINIKFTAQMETILDEIASGKKDWQKYLEQFYNGKEGLLAVAEAHYKAETTNIYKKIQLPKLPEIRISRYGAYIQKEDNKQIENVNIPPDILPSDLNTEYIEDLFKHKKTGNELGIEPKTGLPILLLYGMYGSYLQLGISDNTKEKPKRVSIPKFLPFSEITLNLAIKLLSLPIQLGEHPEGGLIEVNTGRYGPYISRVLSAGKKSFASISYEQIGSVNLEEALEILKNTKKSGRAKKLLRALGEHPVDKNDIGIYEGPYGNYIKHGNVNVAMPKNKTVEDISLEEALGYIEAKSKGGSKKKFRNR